MKKIISILIFVTLPAFVMANGDHADGHDTNSGHKEHSHHDHGSHHNNGMSHDSDEADAGRAGDPAKVSRTIKITMKDTMRFTPDHLKFTTGETVRFVVRNNGKIHHEMVIGSMAELKEHAAMMRTNSTMKHADPNMVSLDSGQQGELVWQFDKPGSFNFACLVPGHLEAGMTGKIEVR